MCPLVPGGIDAPGVGMRLVDLVGKEPLVIWLIRKPYNNDSQSVF